MTSAAVCVSASEDGRGKDAPINRTPLSRKMLLVFGVILSFGGLPGGSFWSVGCRWWGDGHFAGGGAPPQIPPPPGGKALLKGTISLFDSSNDSLRKIHAKVGHL